MNSITSLRRQTWFPEVSTSTPASSRSSAPSRINPRTRRDVLAVGDHEAPAVRDESDAAEASESPGDPAYRRRHRGRVCASSDRGAFDRRRSASIAADLLRDFACTRLANHRHLDLPGIGHLALDLARHVVRQRAACSSFTERGSTMMRISRPACTANDFSTPLNELLMRSRSSSRLT